MKILAIRGENLASLCKPFAVELADPPLSQHGLFAITGPTGAGKSTLLDALCVALFDTMPRLDGGAGVMVGRAGDGEENWVRSSDVRSILRRGAGYAWAEVDFLGIDRRHYRAKWAVQRARRKAEGRLQAQTITLLDLETGQSLGGVKKETLVLIQEKLGLDFDQFRRSIFLSQGEFAAFIKSGASQRGELLEQITGDKIYGRLSVAAHERAALEQNRLNEVKSRLGEIVPLSPEERLEWESRRAGVVEGLAIVHGEQQQLHRLLTWHEQANALAATVATALVQQERAQEQWSRAEERRRNWALLMAAQPLRGVVAAYDHAGQATVEAHNTLATCQTALDRAGVEVTQARGEQTTRRQRLAEQQKYWNELQRLLGQAQALDARLEEARKALAASRKQQQQEVGQLAAHETALTKAKEEGQQIAEMIARLQGWLQGHRHWAPIVVQWPRWSGEIERFRQFMAKNVVLEGEIGGVAQELQRLMVEKDNRIKEQERLRVDLSALDEAVATLQTQLTGLNPPALALQREALQQAKGLVGEILAKQSELTDNQREQHSCTTTVQEGDRQRLVALAERERLVLQQNQVMAALEQARNTVHQDAVALRELLQAGQPCPVCGATAHPYAHETVRLATQWRLQEENLTLLRQQSTQWSETVAREESRVGWAKERLVTLLREEGIKAAALQKLQGQWYPLKAALSLPDDGLTTLAQLLEQRLGQVMVQERQYHAISQQQEQWHRRRQEMVAAAEGQQRGLQQVEEKLQHAGQQRTAWQTEAQVIKQGSQEILATLAEPFADQAAWQQHLYQDARRWQKELHALVLSWQQQETMLTETTSRQQKVQYAQDNLAAEIHRCRQRNALLDAEIVSQQGYLTSLTAERQGVLQGQPWAVVEAAERQKLATVAQEAAAGDLRLAQAEKYVVQCQMAVQHWVSQAAQRQGHLLTAEKTLNDALQDRPLAGVRQLLAVDLLFLEEEKGALEALAAAQRESHILWEERSRQALHHGDQRPVGEMPTDITTHLAALAAKMVELNEILVNANTRLREDDHRRERAAILLQEHERARQVWELWEGVRELIGSATGAKFRTYAQGLTLDFLLVQANHHLVELAPRYRLERAPQSELEIQVVDQEMGDEVRSVASLSGGETFLVSLALALGLSSLAAHRIRVESLFIDEGFGALDGETLEVVLASLDALQSMGRQVGIISHIPTLTERIGAQVRVVPLGGGRSRVRVDKGVQQ